MCVTDCAGFGWSQIEVNGDYLVAGSFGGSLGPR